MIRALAAIQKFNIYKTDCSGRPVATVQREFNYDSDMRLTRLIVFDC